MDIQIVQTPITRTEALKIGKEFYKRMVKGVVDIKKGILALGGEYHLDANTMLIENGSSQKNLWGFNLYLDRAGDNWIEYTSLINIRPADRNRTMKVENPEIRSVIKKIIESLVI